MLRLRRKIIAEKEDEVIGFNPVARDAVLELYSWLFLIYLPKRFPDMFLVERLTATEKTTIRVRNLVTDEIIKLDPSPEPRKCLKLLGMHVDNEFLILLPSSNAQDEPFRTEPTNCLHIAYHLHAYVLTFPSGFMPSKKLGLSLRGVFLASEQTLY